jgi:hypothetical protein
MIPPMAITTDALKQFKATLDALVLLRYHYPRRKNIMSKTIFAVAPIFIIAAGTVVTIPETPYTSDDLEKI